ncbi:hypothetical protein QBC38DRAFT_483600 [Podospora fimiseda]|uniref:SnoaL-like domain-containing protein n=1 Tax=Podospora fimiseda TaxID=252190 RepID=A0AAN7BL11_9PEZI|nr:hypothetical protein QBC38DRAFT_483600 [Podospora fimiseda]
MASTSKKQITNHLKTLYSSYRDTTDIDAKGLFFSTECMQICRPNPSYAATNRETIVRYVREASEGGVGGESSLPSKEGWTARALRDDEFGFGGDDEAVTAPLGLKVSELKDKAMKEGWVGLRVDLWFYDEVRQSEKAGHGVLVKVQYWWRKEGGEWMQILHDIMYMGVLDGSQGTEVEE